MSQVADREIGAARRRVEDPRLVQGQGTYVDDIRLPGTLDVAFVRSPYAHARILSVDTAAAGAAPGVRAVWTGVDVASAQPMPVWGIGEQMALTPQPPLARDKATCAGYPVAAVAAESRYLARDAADLVEVEYEPLPAVTTVEQALAPDAPLLYPELGSNKAFHYTKEAGDVDGAFARADRTVSVRIQHSRVAQIPMEPRAILASYEREADLLTVWRGTQSPHVTKNALSIALGRPEEGIRVIAPDVGGAFGSKGPVYPEEVAVVMLAMALGVPIRWISTRMEDLQLNMQGRDHWDEVEAAFTNEGVITALKTCSLTNFGCIAMMTTAMPPIRIPTYATGAYRIPAIRSEMIAAYTTTAPTGPYRGAGRPEAAYIAERVVHEVARALDADPIEIRRKNFIQPSDFPYTTPNGAFYDSGDYERAMDRALELLDYQAERQRQREARARGALVGIGTASTVEVSSTAWESGAIEVQPDGTIVARTGSSPHGQGHETSFAQVIADYLQVPFESIRLVHGDTATTPYGLGTGGSRSMSLGGSALAQASEEIKKKALQVAAALLEVSVDDLVYERASVQVAGAPERRLTLAEIARAAEQGVGLPPGERGLTYDGRFNPGKDSVPFGTALAVVKVDPETGKVDLQRLVVVDDCGTIINPLLVQGQLHGGLAQGVGQALYERVVYDEDGQLQTATLLDYAVPTAHMVPEYELGFTETPSPYNPLGSKGVGESGCVNGPPAIVNAVLDALAPLGITNLDMPLSEHRVWQAIQAAKQRR